MTEQLNEEKTYDARIEDPELYALANEYLPKKRGNVQRLVRAYLGLEPLNTDVEVMVAMEEVTIVLKHINRMVTESNQLTKKLVAIVSGVSVGVSTLVIYGMKFLEIIF